MHRSKKRAAPVRLGSNYDLAFQAYVSSGQLRTCYRKQLAQVPLENNERPRSWPFNVRLLCADHSQVPLWREIPEHGSDQQ